MVYKFPENIGIYVYNAYDYVSMHLPSVDELVNYLKDDSSYLGAISDENDEDEEGKYVELSDEELQTIAAEFAPRTAKLLIATVIENQKAWVEETDNDRLTRLLLSLEPDIKVFEDFECCSSCGHAEISSRNEAGKLGAPKGYVFYNNQTAEAAVYNRQLHLQYDSFDDEADQLEVPTKIFNALKKEDFEVEWDGTTSNSISLKNFTWRRRYPVK